jgi:hypothetical protein
MAFYVKIIKTADDAASATFTFESSSGATGELRFTKQDAQTMLVRPMPGDEGEHNYVRAAAKLRKEWKAGGLPEMTVWAS